MSGKHSIEATVGYIGWIILAIAWARGLRYCSMVCRSYDISEFGISTIIV